MSEFIKKENLNDDLKRFVEVAEDEGWVVNIYERDESLDFDLYKCSPAGQDFGIHLELSKDADYDEISKALDDYYEGFDVSYETYLWLDNTGHGTNGAPYDMKVLYEDMEACEQFIYDLYNAY